MMNCKEATALMSQQMDHPLILTERMSLKLHLMMCSGCHNFNQHMHDLREITRTYAKGKAQPKVGENQHSSN
ncbi:MAG: zf-HC2 domain-containing protein [Pseudomonas sp.]|nr:zf-HC2 domain-containing protein [Pseudomonas sp.]